MTLNAQLSFIDSENNPNASAKSLHPKITSSQQAAHASGALTYGDVKGRVSDLPAAAPVNVQEIKSPSGQISIPLGYETPSTKEDKYLSVKEVAHRYSVSVPTIWRWSKDDNTFPKPRIIRKGTTRWRLSDLIAFENRGQEA